MKTAFFCVSLIGIAIGLAMPGAKRAPAPAPVTLAASATAPKPVETVLDREASGHFLAVANVNREPIRFVVDTGADTVALTIDDARRAHIQVDPAQFDVIGHGASGPVRGQPIYIDEIELDGKRATNIRAVVLENSEISLLGQTYLRKLNEVRISGDTMKLN